MEWNLGFFVTCAALGVGLAMDAFSVSLANGLNEPKMKAPRMALIAGVFGVMQGVMPLIGWFFVHTAAQAFSAFEALIPWIALALLGYIGFGMLKEGFSGDDAEHEPAPVGFKGLLVQGVATSIDALSVGFTIADYNAAAAAVCALIVAALTFVICFAGLAIGKCCGTKLAGKASVLGGVILIFIGIQIFLDGVGILG